MLLVGLTGNIASGKSTVAQRLVELGATLIDADVLARDAVEPGTPALAQIVARWGPAMLTREGTLDRAQLRARVFEDAAELEVLNAIVHPEVSRLREQALSAARAAGARIVVCDVPLLFERNLADAFDLLVLVDAPRATRLERLMQARGLSEREALAMLAAQMPAELKRARADVVLENAGTPAELVAQVDALWATLRARLTPAPAGP